MGYKERKRKGSVLGMRRGLLFTASAWFIALLIPLAGTASTVYASGGSYFSLSTSGSTSVGGTLTVLVDVTSQASDDANSAEATVSYPSSLLQWQSNAADGIFSSGNNGLCLGNSGGGGTATISCAATSGTVSGTAQFATMTFTVTGTGSATISMKAISDIDNGSGDSVWNSSYPSTGVTLSAASSSGKSSGGSGSKSGGSSGGSSSSSSSSSPTSSATSGGSSTKPTNSSTSTKAGGASSTSSLLSALTVAVTNTNGQPVTGAKVTIDGRYTAYTNSQGYAEFSDVSKGDHEVTVAKSGKTTTETVGMPANQDKTLSLKLASATSASSNNAFVYIASALVILVIAASLGYLRFFRKRPTPVLAPVPQAIAEPSEEAIVVGSNTSAPTVQPVRVRPAVQITAPRARPVRPGRPSVGTDIRRPLSST